MNKYVCAIVSFLFSTITESQENWAGLGTTPQWRVAAPFRQSRRPTSIYRLKGGSEGPRKLQSSFLDCNFLAVNVLERHNSFVNKGIKQSHSRSGTPMSAPLSPLLFSTGKESPGNWPGLGTAPQWRVTAPFQQSRRPHAINPNHKVLFRND